MHCMCQHHYCDAGNLVTLRDHLIQQRYLAIYVDVSGSVYISSTCYLAVQSVEYLIPLAL